MTLLNRSEKSKELESIHFNEITARTISFALPLFAFPKVA